MVPSSAGAVVMVPFPFSDLSQTKLRPAAVLAGAGRGDWVLCQITSSPYADTRAVLLESHDLAVGRRRPAATRHLIDMWDQERRQQLSLCW